MSFPLDIPECCFPPSDSQSRFDPTACPVPVVVLPDLPEWHVCAPLCSSLLICLLRMPGRA